MYIYIPYILNKKRFLNTYKPTAISCRQTSWLLRKHDGRTNTYSNAVSFQSGKHRFFFVMNSYELSSEIFRFKMFWTYYRSRCRGSFCSFLLDKVNPNFPSLLRLRPIIVTKRNAMRHYTIVDIWLIWAPKHYTPVWHCVIKRFPQNNLKKNNNIKAAYNFRDVNTVFNWECVPGLTSLPPTNPQVFSNAVIAQKSSKLPTLTAKKSTKITFSNDKIIYNSSREIPKITNM